MINIVRIDYKAGTFGAASGANLGLDTLIYCTYLVSRSLGRNFKSAFDAILKFYPI